MEILVHLNEENSKRLLVLRKMGILDLDIDNICNDAIEEQLNISGEILSDWADHFESRSKSSWKNIRKGPHLLDQ